MSELTRAQLVQKFVTGYKPTEQDFADLINSALILADDSQSVLPQNYQPPNSPVYLAQDQEVTVIHPVITNEQFMVNVMQEVAGVSGQTNVSVDFAQAAETTNYVQEDSLYGTDFADGVVRLHNSGGTAGTESPVMLNFEGDDSNLTFVGAYLATDAYKFGTKSLWVPTGGNRASVPFVAQLSGDFTIEFFYYRASTWSSNTDNVYFMKDDYNPINLFIDGSGHVCVNGLSSGSGLDSNLGSRSAAFGGYNTWMHMALVRTAGYIKLYINGVAQVINWNGTNWPAASGVPSSAVPNYTSSLTLFGSGNGVYMDSFRMCPSYCAYVDNFTPRTEALAYANYPNGELQGKVKLLLHGEGAQNSTVITDSSLVPKSVACNGASKIVTSVYRLGVSSIQLSGGITVTNSDCALGGTGDFTIDFWVRFDSVGPQQAIIKFADEYGFELESGKLRFWAQNGATPQGATTLSANTWYHIALIRYGTLLRIYLNGTLDGQATADTNAARYDFTTLNFGKQLGSYGANLYGYLDELRVVKGQAMWTANFTPPTVPYDVIVPSYYVTTNDQSHFGFTQALKINSLSVTCSQPSGTAIKCLASFDGRQTWKRWDGVQWAAVGAITDVKTQGNTVTELQTGFVNLTRTTEQFVDLTFDMSTMNHLSSPSIDLVSINYDDNSHYELASIGSYGSAMDFGIKRVDPTTTVIKRLNTNAGRAFITMQI